MPYTFNQYRSSYVDPGSVKISEDLRQKFVDNFQADDALTSEVQNMIALAPDQGAKDLLKEKYQGFIDKRIAEGDYETMGQAIVRDARKFTTEYSPILEQANRRQQIDEELKKRVGSKDNGITNQMYEQAMQFMDNNYAASGGVAKGGAYTGMNVPKYVDVLKEVMDAVDDITPDKQGGITVEATGLGANEAAATGLLGAQGMADALSGGYNEDLRFSYRTKSGSVEYVDPAQVIEIYNAVIGKPEIQEYLAYDSRMKANFMSDEALLETLKITADDLEKQAKGEDVSDEQRAKLNEAAAERRNAILRFNSGAVDPETGRPYVTREQLQGMAEGAIMMNTLDPIRRAAITEGSYYQEGDSEQILRVDQAWTNARTAQRQNNLTFAGMSGNLQEMVSPGGTSFESQQAFLDKQKEELENMKTGELSQQIQQQLGLTYDELAGMSAQEFAARQGIDMNDPNSASQMALFNRHKTNLLEAEAAVFATEEAMRQVREELGYNEGAVLNQVLEIPTGGSEMAALGFGTLQSTVAKMGEVLPNMSQEARLKLLMSMAASMNPSQHAGFQNFDGSKVDPKTFQEFALNNREQAQQLQQLLSANGVSIFSSVGFIKGLEDARELVNTDIMDQMNAEMQKRTTRQYSPTVYNIIPGMGKAEKAAMLDLTKGMPMTSFSFVNPQTGSLVAADEFFESWSELNRDRDTGDFDISTAAVQDINFNIANLGPHGGTVDMTIKDKNGNTVTAQVPMTQFHNEDVRAYTNGDAYRVMRQAANQFAAGINVPVVHLKNNETGAITPIEIDFRTQTYRDPATGKSGDLTTALAPGGELANLSGYNSTVVPRREQ